MYYLLLYDVVEDYLERRGAYRDEHLGLARDAHASGLLVMAGAFADPPDGAALVFRAEDPGPVEAFARQDPYVKHGVVTRWRVRPWNVVVGA